MSASKDGVEQPLSAIGRQELLELVERLRDENARLRGYLAHVVRRSVGTSGRIVIRPDPPDAKPLPELRIDPEPGGVRVWFGVARPGDP